ncbi:hypothetical protein AAE02nite_31030 [Adhaeribacter aerolatus]|uniref:DUF2179 domain-containing protein n=1 Tax=Adhaeribacter aerolatus TaxID=670289 RepID=A0A512B0F7_9BACT|nr:YitT family protein [Adhaeribacter aerolatus]GEO05439.1 hypothetical protein AAE02nite_31030 [Adhaeribacter aerolatus]
MPQLEKNLPAHLKYHNADHTKSVIAAAEKIAVAEGVTDEELVLLKTAALYHDAGFLNAYKNHEEASCHIARKTLPALGFEPLQIDTICQIIMATKLPHAPADKLQYIICDADLQYLGTTDYFPNAEHLYQEFKANGLVKNRLEWNRKQIAFLTSHRFFTQYAKTHYAEHKVNHLNIVLSNANNVDRRHLIVSELQDFFLIMAGVILAGFALKGFLVPNQFFDGGVTGMSLLLHELYHFNLAYIIVTLNLPLIIAAYFTVSKKFAFKTFLSVLLLGFCLLLIPYPVVTSDKLLISIFGGVFLGLGVGLTMRAGCALDGIEVLALYTLKRTSFTITEIILGLNIIIFTIAAFKFGLETALYSILTYFAASRMIDYVIEGIEAYTGVTIISGESEMIKYRLVNELGRGITVYKGERGFLPGKFDVSSNCDIIFTVVTRMELRKLKTLVYEADAKAFVFATTIREASGGIIKRRAAH